MSDSIYDFIARTIEAEEEDNQQDTDITVQAMTKADVEKTLWYYKKLRLEIAEMEQQAEDYVKEAQKTANQFLLKNCAKKKEWLNTLEQTLRDYTEEQIKTTGKKSVKMVNGTMSFVKQQPKYERNEEAILTYIDSIADSDNPLLNFVKPQPAKLDWAGLKKAGTVKEIDGVKRLVVDKVTVPSVKVIDQDDAFKVK